MAVLAHHRSMHRHRAMRHHVTPFGMQFPFLVNRQRSLRSNRRRSDHYISIHRQHPRLNIQHPWNLMSSIHRGHLAWRVCTGTQHDRCLRMAHHHITRHGPLQGYRTLTFAYVMKHITVRCGCLFRHIRHNLTRLVRIQLHLAIFDMDMLGHRQRRLVRPGICQHQTATAQSQRFCRQRILYADLKPGIIPYTNRQCIQRSAQNHLIRAATRIRQLLQSRCRM